MLKFGSSPDHLKDFVCDASIFSFEEYILQLYSVEAAAMLL